MQKALIISLVLFGSCCPNLSFSQETVRIRSTNYPNHSVRHKNFNVVLEELSPVQDTPEAYFKVRTGLVGCDDCISFESNDYPGYYLRHHNFILKLAKLEDSDLYRKDATFYKREVDDGLFVFESFNFPGYFVRHQNFVLRISPYTNTELFSGDCTFRFY